MTRKNCCLRAHCWHWRGQLQRQCPAVRGRCLVQILKKYRRVKPSNYPVECRNGRLRWQSGYGKGRQSMMVDHVLEEFYNQYPGKQKKQVKRRRVVRGVGAEARRHKAPCRSPAEKKRGPSTYSLQPCRNGILALLDTTLVTGDIA